MVFYSSRKKAQRQWVGQYDFSNYALPALSSDTISNDKTLTFRKDISYDHCNYSDHGSDHNKYKITSCLRPLYKLNRNRALLCIIAITLVTLNGIEKKLFGLPLRLELFYKQQQSLRDRNLRGCDEMTAKQQLSLRNRKLTGCEKDSYINPEEAFKFLSFMENRKTSHDTDGEIEPSHISLCKELIKRNNDSESKEEDSVTPTNPFLNKIQTNGVFEVHESEDICTDWERPHSSLMRIISSSIIAYVGGRFNLSYKHGCHSSIPFGSELEFDVTTVQQIFPQNPMPLNENIVSLGEVVFDLCQNCMNEHSNLGDLPSEDNREDTHHCFLFPNKGEAHTGSVQDEESYSTTEEVLDEGGHIVNTALEAVLPLVRNRLYHASIDWSPRAHIPSHDPKSGAVIYIDATQSLPIPFHFFHPRIPSHVTHVSIISSPACVTSKIGSKDCYTYAFQLQQYLQNKYLGIDVSLDLMSSTAAAYSRMILSHTLICPPGTITCLFPALAREITKESIIFESSNRPSTFHWFNYLAKSKSRSISIIPVSESEILQVDFEQDNIERQFKAIEVSEVLKSEGSTSLMNASDKLKRAQSNFDQVMVQENSDPFKYTISLATNKETNNISDNGKSESTERSFPEYSEENTSNGRFKDSESFLKEKVMARDKSVLYDSIMNLPTKSSTNTVESHNKEKESTEVSFPRYVMNDNNADNEENQYADTAKLFGD